MCNHENSKKVLVIIPADLSYTHADRRSYVKIDSCIAPIVRALARAGIRTRGSCCGHNKCDGYITLQDGRELIIKTEAMHEK
jgi:hypothetical protein